MGEGFEDKNQEFANQSNHLSSEINIFSQALHKNKQALALSLYFGS